MHIDRSNYSDLLIARMEGLLDDSTCEQLEDYLGRHPDLQAEAQAFEMTRLQPDESLVYPDLPSLLREESDTGIPVAPVKGIGRVIRFSGNLRLRRIAAVLLLLALSLPAYFLLRDRQERAETHVSEFAELPPPAGHDVADAPDAATPGFHSDGSTPAGGDSVEETVLASGRTSGKSAIGQDASQRGRRADLPLIQAQASTPASEPVSVVAANSSDESGEVAVYTPSMQKVDIVPALPNEQRFAHSAIPAGMMEAQEAWAAHQLAGTVLPEMPEPENAAWIETESSRIADLVQDLEVLATGGRIAARGLGKWLVGSGQNDREPEVSQATVNDANSPKAMVDGSSASAASAEEATRALRLEAGPFSIYLRREPSERRRLLSGQRKSLPERLRGANND